MVIRCQKQQVSVDGSGIVTTLNARLCCCCYNAALRHVIQSLGQNVAPAMEKKLWNDTRNFRNGQLLFIPFVLMHGAFRDIFQNDHEQYMHEKDMLLLANAVEDVYHHLTLSTPPDNHSTFVSVSELIQRDFCKYDSNTRWWISAAVDARLTRF
jgi:hypothetical protein